MRIVKRQHDVIVRSGGVGHLVTRSRTEIGKIGKRGSSSKAKHSAVRGEPCLALSILEKRAHDGRHAEPGLHLDEPLPVESVKAVLPQDGQLASLRLEDPAERAFGEAIGFVVAREAMPCQPGDPAGPRTVEIHRSPS